MGIILESGGGYSSNFSVENIEVNNIYHYGLELVQESEDNTVRFMKSLYIADAQGLLESTDEEVLTEAVSDVLNKIKALFVALGEKIKKIFSAFMTKVASFGNDVSFVDKYGKKFIEKWEGEVKSGFKFKGYKFTITDTVSGAAGTSNTIFTNVAVAESHDKVKALINACKPSTTGDWSTIDIEKIDSGAVLEDIKTAKKDLDDVDNSDIDDKVRGIICAGLFGITATGTSPSGDMNDKEFRENLFKMYRNDESSKIDLEKSDIDSNALFRMLKDSAKTKSNVKSFTDKLLKSVNDIINKIEKQQTQALKFSALKEKQPNADKVSYQAIVIAVLSKILTISKFSKECATTGLAAYSQALVDRNRQAKAIMAKVLAGGKATQQESTSYEGTSSGLFDFKIV